MAELSTIARPYAQAVFSLAESQGEMPQWSSVLEVLALMASDDRVLALASDPGIDKADLISLVSDVCGDMANDHVKALIALLVENHRLSVLPEIAGLYNNYRAEAEKSIQVDVTSAYALNAKQKEGIISAMKKRLGREIKIVVKTDKSLLGGAIIRAGDLVIDGSIVKQMQRLGSTLSR